MTKRILERTACGPRIGILVFNDWSIFSRKLKTAMDQWDDLQQIYFIAAPKVVAQLGKLIAEMIDARVEIKPNVNGSQMIGERLCPVRYSRRYVSVPWPSKMLYRQ